MRKLSKIILVGIILIMILTICTEATFQDGKYITNGIDKQTYEHNNFKISLNTENKIIQIGNEITVTAKVSDFTNKNNGIIALSGKLEFDKDKLEIKSVNGLNSWAFSEEDYNLENFKFVTVGNKVINEENEVFEIVFKVKNNAEIGNTDIKFSSVEAGTGQTVNGVLYAADTSLTLQIQEKEQLLLGDIDLDGEIAVNDLAQLKLHLIEEELIIEKKRLKIADLDQDGDITINDLAKLKLMIISDLEDKNTILVSSIEEMKKLADVKDGQIVKSEGYYNKELGGKAKYNIVKETKLNIDNAMCFRLDNGLYAELIIENNTITPNQFGAYGDGIHDDTYAISKALNAKIENVLFESKEYDFESRITVASSNLNIIGNNSTLYFGLYKSSDMFGQLLFEGAHDKHVENITVSNMNFVNKNVQKDGRDTDTQVIGRFCDNIKFDNCSFLITYEENNMNRKFTNLWFDREWRDITVENCTFTNLSKAKAGGCLWLSDFTDDTEFISGNVIVRNNKFEKSSTDEVLAIWDGHIKGVEIYENSIYHHDEGVEEPSVMTVTLANIEGIAEDIIFRDNYVKCEYVEIFALINGAEGSKNITVENNIIEYDKANPVNTNSAFFNIMSDNKNVIIKNNDIKINDSPIGRFVYGVGTFEGNNIEISNSKIITEISYTKSNYINNIFKLKSNNFEKGWMLFRNAPNVVGNKIYVDSKINSTVIGYDAEVTDEINISNNEIYLYEDTNWNEFTKNFVGFYDVNILKNINITNNYIEASKQSKNQRIIELLRVKANSLINVNINNNTSEKFSKVDLSGDVDKLYVTVNGKKY